MKTLLTILLTVLFPTLLMADVVTISHPGGTLDAWLNTAPAGVATAYTEPAVPAGTTTYYAAASYPTHSVSWHIIGSRESREELISHLMTHPEHADVRRVYTANDLHHMTRAQLQTLHDDSHERRIATRYTRTVTVAAPAVARSVSVTYSAPRVSSYSNYSSACPNGNCPMTSTLRQRIRARRAARQQARLDAASQAGIVGANFQLGLLNVSK